MKAYIGTKIIQAEAVEPTGDHPDAGYRVIYEDGYTSWSPKDVFERCYREITSEEANLVNTAGTPT